MSRVRLAITLFHLRGKLAGVCGPGRLACFGLVPGSGVSECVVRVASGFVGDPQGLISHIGVVSLPGRLVLRVGLIVGYAFQCLLQVDGGSGNDVPQLLTDTPWNTSLPLPSTMETAQP